MTFPYYIVAFFIGLFPYGSVFSQMKNDMPCLSDVCIGDSVEALQKTTFFEATILGDSPGAPNVPTFAARIHERDVDAFSKKFIGQRDVITYLAIYANYRQFDNRILPLFNKVEAICDNLNMDLIGQFKSEGGHPTWVTINVINTGKGSRPRLGVIKIEREFIGITSAEQLTELEKQIFQTYKTMGYNGPNPRAGTEPGQLAAYRNDITKKISRPRVSWISGMSPTLTLWAPDGWRISRDELKFQKECGGTKNIININ